MKNNDLTMRIEEGHFIVNDDCKQKLKKSPILSYRGGPIVEWHNDLIQHTFLDLRDTNSLYLNLVILDSYFEREDILFLKCLECGRKYEIKKEDYVALRKKI